MKESLKALLSNIVDYAGLYPPASLPLAEVLANYQRYRCSPEAWMLNRLVLPVTQLSSLSLGAEWRVTLLVDQEPGPLPPQVETLETKTGSRLSLATYCEVPLDQVHDGFAKIRTANISAEALADFLCGAAARNLPFKATAGLHHPIRSAGMHGFLNVFTGAILVWLGMDRTSLLALLNETDPHSFHFGNELLRWREWSASTSEIDEARRDFAHSFGSCSFEEPVADLRALRLLP